MENNISIKILTNEQQLRVILAALEAAYPDTEVDQYGQNVRMGLIDCIRMTLLDPKSWGRDMLHGFVA